MVQVSETAMSARDAGIVSECVDKAGRLLHEARITLLACVTLTLARRASSAR